MKIEWKDNFFAGFSYVDLFVDGSKVYGASYTIEHLSPPAKNKYKIDKTGQFVESEQVARDTILKENKI